MECNKDEFDYAKKLVGKKALLMGGGQFLNGFQMVSVKSVNEKSCSVKIWDGEREREPFISSWYLREPSKELADLSEGSYLVTGGDRFGETNIRKEDCGIFGTIYDCTVAKTLKDEKVEKRRKELLKTNADKSKAQLIRELGGSSYYRKHDKDYLLDLAVDRKIRNEYRKKEEE